MNELDSWYQKQKPFTGFYFGLTIERVFVHLEG